MLAGAHKKFYRIQHPQIYLLDLNWVLYKHKIKLPLDMVTKHVFLYLCLPDYELYSIYQEVAFSNNRRSKKHGGYCAVSTEVNVLSWYNPPEILHSLK